MLQNANMSHSEINAYLQAQEIMAQGGNPAHPAPPDEMGDMPKQKPIKAEIKVGRNDLCPCGSGKKYKKCCGKMEFLDHDDN
jgi:preprotein translocase subunit SecA